MNLATWLPIVLCIAWLLPLAAFATVWIGFSMPLLAGRRVKYSTQRYAGWLATMAIGGSCGLSLLALGIWLSAHALAPTDHTAPHAPIVYSGDLYLLAAFGDLRLTIGYYIDSLTIVMFALVTLISTCVHVYSMGYMRDELGDLTDREVANAEGDFLRRPGRYQRFFQYLSLFSFAMLGIVLAGNLAMVFVFWELVGICSYFLIGFYFERPAASRAANKAFIVNRVGDFGILIGLMVLWNSLGTLHFDDSHHGDSTTPGIFSLLHDQQHEHQLSARAMSPQQSDSYWLLFVAGIGLFCGCIGKSAQFPLHTWLPDAMEGPTPVSALVHSATMVAAGVYLVGRCYPIFVPEALLTIAVVGAITLALAASIAITSVDIKRVLAYSTISQLGYMMLALGLGGWIAGLFHLVTHAFFKSLLFLCSGSVIHSVGTNDLRLMGGLRHKMPWTAYTMLLGCLAIAGAGFPAWGVGLSGYFSKDAIIEQAWSFTTVNNSPSYQLLLWIPLAGTFVTACYMFRLWYMTFAGAPTDSERFEHAHESPRSMVGVLVLLALFSVGVGWSFPFSDLSVTSLLRQSQPAATAENITGVWLPGLTLPAEYLSHVPEIKNPASWAAFAAALGGFLLATLIYAWRWLRAEEISDSFAPIHRLLVNAWWFDSLYDIMLVRPVLWTSQRLAAIDRAVIDPLVNGLAKITKLAARWFEQIIDRRVIDRSIDGLANQTWNLGSSLRRLQTGVLRQYVLFIVLSTLGMFAIASLFWKYALAG